MSYLKEHSSSAFRNELAHVKCWDLEHGTFIPGWLDHYGYDLVFFSTLLLPGVLFCNLLSVYCLSLEGEHRIHADRGLGYFVSLEPGIVLMLNKNLPKT